MEGENNTTNIIFGFVMILLLIFLGFFFMFYYQIIPNKMFEPRNEETMTEDFDMRIVCPEGSEYRLEYKNQELASGLIDFRYVEIVQNLHVGKDYFLECWDDDDEGIDYYYDRKNCINQTRCELELHKEGRIATDIMRDNEEIEYEIYIWDGIIRYPIICVAYKRLYYLNSDQREIPVIERLEPYVDRCYTLDENIFDGRKTIRFDFDIIDREAELKFYIIDKCYAETDDYHDCGIPDHTEKIEI